MIDSAKKEKLRKSLSEKMIYISANNFSPRWVSKSIFVNVSRLRDTTRMIIKLEFYLIVFGLEKNIYILAKFIILSRRVEMQNYGNLYK